MQSSKTTEKKKEKNESKKTKAAAKDVEAESRKKSSNKENKEANKDVAAAITDANVKGNSITIDSPASAENDPNKAPAQISEPSSDKSFYTKEELEKFKVKDFLKRHLTDGSRKLEYEPHELHIILDKCKEVLEKCSTLVEVKAPVNVCGDIHGQYCDLMRIFNSGGLPGVSRYLFLGDYVDRGRHSLEVISMLLACRLQWPKNVFLLRGNHELANINKSYGFLSELQSRMRNQQDQLCYRKLYDHFNEVFALLPLAAIINQRILCMHGGLSPELNSLDDIRKIQRPLKIVRGLAQDLLWADPEIGIKGFQKNKVRAVSHIFGEDAVAEKCAQLDIDMVIRAHQVVEYGYSFFAQKKLVTVFSAARYHDELVNYAAVIKVQEDLTLIIRQLRPAEFVKQRNDNLKKRQQTGNVEEEE